MTQEASTLPSTHVPAPVREKLDLVVVGHVDHGKSTVIGRLLADTGSLPQGKIEQVKALCAKNAKPFEYAFLLDALKNEQAQGITIDAARCFFRSKNRDYIINDAPGHIEFLKNMITGAARAEAALLVIDAHEGIQENSRRHGYILSMLGIRQLAVLVNKMDLVDYRQDVFEKITADFGAFLAHLGVRPQRFIPISAFEGDNLAARSTRTPWYDGPTTLEQLDLFSKASPDGGSNGVPFRMPVQDVYKFTEHGDDRRIVAGTVSSGRIQNGERVVFLPSGKTSEVRRIESFNTPLLEETGPGQSIGFSLTTQVYVRPGELMCKAGEIKPRTATRFRANLFWMGRAPMVPGRRYKLKIGAARVPVELVRLLHVVDANELTALEGKEQIDRHDVAECLLETARPVAFDRLSVLESTSRFVIVDHYEIAACGTVLEEIDEGAPLLQERIRARDRSWEKGYVKNMDRTARSAHSGKFILFAGAQEDGAQELAKQLEKKLFLAGLQTYYLSVSNVFDDLEKKQAVEMEREEQILQLGELAHIMTDAGILFITALGLVDDFDLEKLRILNEPYELFVVGIGKAATGAFNPHVQLPANPDIPEALERIVRALNASGVLPEYSI